MTLVMFAFCVTFISFTRRATVAVGFEEGLIQGAAMPVVPSFPVIRSV